MVVGDRALSLERGRDRDVQTFGEAPKRGHRMVAGHTGAGQHDGVGGRSERLRCALHLVLRRRGVARHIDLERLGVGQPLGDVLGHDDECGAGPLGLGLFERLAHHLRGGVAKRNHVAPLRDGPVDGHEIHDLVRLLVEPVQARLRHQRHQRVRVELGVRDSEHQVERAGAEGRQTHARLAGQRSVGVGHERGTALVARRDEPDGGIGQGVDDVQVLLARQAEDVLDPLVFETGDEQLRDGALGGWVHTESVTAAADQPPGRNSSRVMWRCPTCSPTCASAWAAA